MTALHYLSATELLAGIKNKEFSAEEVMQAHLMQIEQVNPAINALTQRFSPEQCLVQARKIDNDIAHQRPLGRLAGLPVAIKDALNVAGLVCSSANRSLFNQGTAKSDATIIQRLKKHGAIIIGLTNVPELCRGGDSDNLVYGRTNNPYDVTRTSGGSSGGSAALVAAGGVPLAIGSDGGGSIVQPCHCNGVSGLKPSHGLIPPTGTVGGDNWGMIGQFITYGPLARSVHDLQLSLSLIAGPDNKYPYTEPVALKPAIPLSACRIAYFTENKVIAVDQEIQHCVKNAALSLQDEAAVVVEAMPEVIAKAYDLHWDLFLGGDKGEGFKKILGDLGAEQLSWN